MDLVSLSSAILGLLIFTILTQDIHVFPGAFFSKLSYFSQRRKKIPRQVEAIFIKASDGTKLEVWRYSPEIETPLSKYVAIIFHGNGGPVESFLFIQMWLSELGIPSYNFDYRGFGRSSGWPNEKGIYKDSDAVWDYVVDREHLDASRILIFGISVGSGPASRIAALHKPKLLLLSSPFTSLKNTVKDQPLIGFLAPFVWNKFPTLKYVHQLGPTDLLIVHAENDKIIPSAHSIAIEAGYSKQGRVRRLCSEEGGHNMAFYDLRDKIKETLVEWL